MNNDLLERNFLDTAGTKIKNFGSRLGNAVVAGTGQTFGARATKSNSRLSINIIANELTHNWEKWLTAMRAGGHNVEGDMNDLYRYIEKYFVHALVAVFFDCQTLKSLISRKMRPTIG